MQKLDLEKVELEKSCENENQVSSSQRSISSCVVHGQTVFTVIVPKKKKAEQKNSNFLAKKVVAQRMKKYIYDMPEEIQQTRLKDFIANAEFFNAKSEFF